MARHVLALSGPRACGKSTIAKHLVNHHGYRESPFRTHCVSLLLVQVRRTSTTEPTSLALAQPSEKCGQRFCLKSTAPN